MRYARDGWSVEQGAAKGRPLPQWFLDEPPRAPMDEFYMSAFWDLSTCRAIGMTVGPIPWNRIMEYAEFAGLDRLNAFDFAAIIRRLDGAYLDHLMKKEDSSGPPVSRPPVSSKSFRGRK